MIEPTEGPHSWIFEVAGGGSDLLADIEPPEGSTEFRLVVEDDSYDSGFRTSSPFSTDEGPADVAERLGLSDSVVRVIYGKPE